MEVLTWGEITLFLRIWQIKFYYRVREKHPNSTCHHHVITPWTHIPLVWVRPGNLPHSTLTGWWDSFFYTLIHVSVNRPIHKKRQTMQYYLSRISTTRTPKLFHRSFISSSFDCNAVRTSPASKSINICLPLSFKPWNIAWWEDMSSSSSWWRRRKN